MQEIGVFMLNRWKNFSVEAITYVFLKEIVVFMLNWRKKISVDAINYVFLRFAANIKKMFVIRIRKKYIHFLVYL